MSAKGMNGSGINCAAGAGGALEADAGDAPRPAAANGAVRAAPAGDAHHANEITPDWLRYGIPLGIGACSQLVHRRPWWLRAAARQRKQPPVAELAGVTPGALWL
jgi:hypothetical protein